MLESIWHWVGNIFAGLIVLFLVAITAHSISTAEPRMGKRDERILFILLVIAGLWGIWWAGRWW